MSLTVTRPPRVTRNISTYQASRRFYTLHNNPNTVFAWRTGSERMKTTSVAFRNYQDALLMAHMIERHVRQKKEWPGVTMFDFHLMSGPIQNNNELELVTIRQWDFDQLKVFCVRSYLDIIALNKLTPTDDGFRVTGELIKLDVPTEYYAQVLNYLHETY